MNSQKHGGIRSKSILVILYASFVGCANLTQNCAASFENIRDSKRAADLDKFPARNNHFLARSEGVQDHEYRCRIIIHHRCGFTIQNLLEQRLEQLIPVRPRTFRNIVFQVGVICRKHRQALLRSSRKRRATQIGMKNHP